MCICCGDEDAVILENLSICSVCRNPHYRGISAGTDKTPTWVLAKVTRKQCVKCHAAIGVVDRKDGVSQQCPYCSHPVNSEISRDEGVSGRETELKHKPKRTSESKADFITGDDEKAVADFIKLIVGHIGASGDCATDYGLALRHHYRYSLWHKAQQVFVGTEEVPNVESGKTMVASGDFEIRPNLTNKHGLFAAFQRWTKTAGNAKTGLRLKEFNIVALKHISLTETPVYAISFDSPEKVYNRMYVLK